MTDISFTLASGTVEGFQDQILNNLRRVEGVEYVLRIDEQSPLESLRRMCVLRAKDDNVQTIVDALKSTPGVNSETVAVESQRGFEITTRDWYVILPENISIAAGQQLIRRWGAKIKNYALVTTDKGMALLVTGPIDLKDRVKENPGVEVI